MQEESLIFGKPCVILRNSTERPEGLKTNFQFLTKLDVERSKEKIKEYTSKNFKVEKFEKLFKEQLKKKFELKPLKIADKQISSDKTVKILFELEDHEKIETVLIPTPKRMTICISTQAGCKFGCRFCASGVLGWQRNLTPAEILTQIRHVKDECTKRKKELTRG